MRHSREHATVIDCHSPDPAGLTPVVGAAGRRGIAMLLVLISLAMATVLATSYLASRDNSTVIGSNIADATAARWAAESGLEAGVAILETEVDWRNSHTNGKLVDDYAIAGAFVDLDVIDVETGKPPTSETEYVQLTATATANGLSQTAIAIAYVPQSDGDSKVDVDLSEFAIFASDYIELRDDATVTRWPNAPLSSLSRRLAMGTRATDAFSITIDGNAATIDTDVYYGPNASNSLVTISNSTAVSEVKLLDNIPLPDAPDPGVATPDGIAIGDFVLADDTVTTINSSGRRDNFDFGNRSKITVQGDIRLVADGDFYLRDDAQMIVDGNVSIVVWDDFYLRKRSSIELTDGSTLTMFIGDHMYLDDGYMGDVRADNTRDNTGSASYMDPERLRLFTIDSWSPDSSADWILNNNSVVKGNLYGPSTNLTIEDTSAVYGRVASKTILLKHFGAIFYDHGLDSGTGFTVLDSAVYNDDGTIKSEFLSLSDLDDSSLQSLSDSTSLLVTSDDREFGTADTADTSGSPTPRPIPVEVVMNALGTPVESWE